MHEAYVFCDRVISGINLGAGAEFTEGYSLFLEQVSDTFETLVTHLLIILF
jgi:hypothetical protein